jgi:hypothetical protein
MLMLPAETPCTWPIAETVPIARFELLHVPPATVLLRKALLPAQMAVVPLMVPGDTIVSTEIIVVARSAPHEPLSV